MRQCGMKSVKILFSIVFVLMLVSNVRSILGWTESRGVYDDICYLRQAHLFQRFGWQGLDTNLSRADDGFLAGRLRAIGYPTWSDVTTAPCHSKSLDGSKLVLTPPPGTGFILSLFPEGFQVIPLYVLANLIIVCFALLALWRAAAPASLAVAAAAGAMSIYFMINPSKASYSIAPTMVACALAGLLTEQLFMWERRHRIPTASAVGLVLGISASFRLANILLSAGYLLFFGGSFLIWRNRARFAEAFSFGLAFLIGLLPLLVANAINEGSPFVTTYGGADTALPSVDLVVLRAYVTDLQFPLFVVMCGWTSVLYLSRQLGAKSVALVLAGNLAVNLSFFATHPIFTSYYTIPISMLSFWTLLFATIRVSAKEKRAEVGGPLVSDTSALHAGT